MSKNVFKEKYLSEMKYDVKTSEMMFLLIMVQKCISERFEKKNFHICKTNNWTNKSAF